MREIVLDTETTGFDPEKGDRIIEIGCLEVENHVPTGKTYWQYINCERDVPEEAVAVHGITTEFLKDKPVFGEIVGDFLDFIGDSPMVIHNAEFDIKFLNHELKQLGFPQFKLKDAVDTLKIARKKFPGSPANLDALCRRFGIDNTAREYHGALLDAQLLAEVYLELNGGRQHGLAIDAEAKDGVLDATGGAKAERNFREARVFEISKEEQKSHTEMLESLTNPIWKKKG
ncbi:MAG: DNA polymerase III subunit epsilon [Alphaproteobacteria bacterium]|nr:DNA polymerase III subunit epsilon [Alphaproteobacteria bacterium]